MLWFTLMFLGFAAFAQAVPFILITFSTHLYLSKSQQSLREIGGKFKQRVENWNFIWLKKNVGYKQQISNVISRRVVGVSCIFSSNYRSWSAENLKIKGIVGPNPERNVNCAEIISKASLCFSFSRWLFPHFFHPANAVKGVLSSIAISKEAGFAKVNT